MPVENHRRGAKRLCHRDAEKTAIGPGPVTTTLSPATRPPNSVNPYIAVPADGGGEQCDLTTDAAPCAGYDHRLAVQGLRRRHLSTSHHPLHALNQPFSLSD